MVTQKVLVVYQSLGIHIRIGMMVENFKGRSEWLGKVLPVYWSLGTPATLAPAVHVTSCWNQDNNRSSGVGLRPEKLPQKA